MWAKRIQRMIEKNRNDVVGILLRKYPAFVLSDREHVVIDIPAFVFHDVTPKLLEPLLEFLAENKYRTLTADEYVERKVRGQRGREREVLLTFDDGHKSLYTVVYPALKRFGLKAVSYIVPGMVPDDETSNERESSRHLLCNWKQIREMHESGQIDVQSHSMYHHSIPISERVTDFARPGLKFSFLTSDLAPLIQLNGRAGHLDTLPYGTPIHDWGSRFSNAPAFRESEAVISACIEYVNRNGGPDYFNHRSWRHRLTVIVAKTRRMESTATTYEIEAEQRQAILKDLVDSKREIEEQLPGKRVQHFCYPWFRGSRIGMELSAEAGYISNAWGSLLPDFVLEDRPSLPIPRLTWLYGWRLPGKGRKSMSHVLRAKLSALGFGIVAQA